MKADKGESVYGIIYTAFHQGTGGAESRGNIYRVAALGRIRKILKDTALEDAECFKKIEAVVCEYEALGLDCGARHDFG